MSIRYGSCPVDYRDINHPCPGGNLARTEPVVEYNNDEGSSRINGYGYELDYTIDVHRRHIHKLLFWIARVGAKRVKGVPPGLAGTIAPGISENTMVQDISDMELF